MCCSGDTVSIKLRNLLLWSWNNTSEEQQQIFWGLLAWLAAVTDISLPVSDASDNPLDAPELVGPLGRSCNIPLTKMRIARLAAHGRSFKSPQAVLTGQSALKGKKGVKKGHLKSANQWVEPYAWKLLGRVREVFDWESSSPVISLAWDATRLSRKEILVTTIYNHAKRMAGWCPPMAPKVFQ